MSTKMVLAFGIVSCLVFGDAAASAESKLSVLTRVSNLNGKLVLIARQRQKLAANGTKSFNDAEIKRIIDAQSDIDVLHHLAAVSRSNSQPGRAEDHVVDDVFDVAWTMCISRIERIGGEAAIRALEDISLEYQLDGAYSLDIREALERLRSHQ